MFFWGECTIFRHIQYELHSACVSLVLLRSACTQHLRQEGDLYDPAGTITGGSAPKGGNTLMKLQELFGAE